MPWVVQAVGAGMLFWIDPNGGLSDRHEDAAVFVSHPEAQEALGRMTWIFATGSVAVSSHSTLPTSPLAFSVVDAEARP
jgi:hypothetical protein